MAPCCFSLITHQSECWYWTRHSRHKRQRCVGRGQQRLEGIVKYREFDLGWRTCNSRLGGFESKQYFQSFGINSTRERLRAGNVEERSFHISKPRHVAFSHIFPFPKTQSDIKSRRAADVHGAYPRSVLLFSVVDIRLKLSSSSSALPRLYISKIYNDLLAQEVHHQLCYANVCPFSYLRYSTVLIEIKTVCFLHYV